MERLKNRFYHQDLLNFYRFNIPPKNSILNINHGLDFFRNKLKAKKYVSFNILKKNPLPKDYFDFVIISDTLSITEDIQLLFHQVKNCINPESRLMVNYHNFFWLPLLNLAEKLHLKNPQNRTNWLNTNDITNLLETEGYQVIKSGRRLLCPLYIPFLSNLINKYIANLPLISKFCFTNFIIAQLLPTTAKDLSVSIIIPARNEKGNIENAVKRIPLFGKHQEIVFVEGHSKDKTWDTILKVQKKYQYKDIKAVKQEGKGKADAVRKGFNVATGNILMILDADLTVPPEELPKFYNAIASGKGEYINGCRLVYPMEKEAMQFLNVIGNHFFSVAFSWILSQKIKDTLCGTKVLSKENYLKIAQNHTYFGDFDPFGDYDLIFGAAKLNLKFVEIPIHYKAREYGQTNISRFKHGWLLIKMVIFALNKIKFI